MTRLLVILLFIAVLPAMGLQPGRHRHFGKPALPRLKSVCIDGITWMRGFWADGFQTVMNISLPAMWEALQIPINAASFRNPRIAAGSRRTNSGVSDWRGGDGYKWVETVATSTWSPRTPKLDG